MAENISADELEGEAFEEGRRRAVAGMSGRREETLSGDARKNSRPFETKARSSEE